MKAMIFAAGLGTRLKPLTDTMPKALVPLGGKPLLQWQVEKLREAGIMDIVVNVHHFPDQIIDAIRADNPSIVLTPLDEAHTGSVDDSDDDADLFIGRMKSRLPSSYETGPEAIYT